MGSKDTLCQLGSLTVPKEGEILVGEPPAKHAIASDLLTITEFYIIASLLQFLPLHALAM